MCQPITDGHVWTWSGTSWRCSTCAKPSRGKCGRRCRGVLHRSHTHRSQRFRAAKIREVDGVPFMDFLACGGLRTGSKGLEEEPHVGLQPPGLQDLVELEQALQWATRVVEGHGPEHLPADETEDPFGFRLL